MRALLVTALVEAAFLCCLATMAVAQNSHDAELQQAVSGSAVVSCKTRSNGKGAPVQSAKTANSSPGNPSNTRGKASTSIQNSTIDLRNSVKGDVEARGHSTVSVGGLGLGHSSSTPRSNQTSVIRAHELAGQQLARNEAEMELPPELLYALLYQSRGDADKDLSGLGLGFTNLHDLGWEVKGEKKKYWNGLDSLLWYNHKLDQYVAVFEGTESITENTIGSILDWSTNFLQTAGLPSQYDTAIDIAKEMSDKAGDSDLIFVGHSLGGGMASAAAIITGRKATTFNAAGVNWMTLARNLKSKRSADELVDAYYVEGEVLNMTQDVVASFVPFSAAIPGFKLPFQDTIYEALGTRHGISSSSTEQMNTFKKHGMDAVISCLLDAHSKS